ncbi:Amyrin synthase LUP2 [Citrus sinensis]|nr:Amyrin synthase LUP2 [Citrus sinensis]
MWRLKIGDHRTKNDPYIFSTNNHVGRQIWEFDPDADSPEELAEVEGARLNYFNNRFNVKNSSNLIWQIQVIYLYITGYLNSVLSSEHRKEMLRYTYNHQILGVYDWSGCNPMPPEFWKIPSFLPISPGKLNCYCRVTYMPMSYLYGKRFVGPITPLILQLREEIYTQPYTDIDWSKMRHFCAKEDIFFPHTTVQNLLWDTLYNVVEPILNRWPLNKLREKSLEIAMNHIHYEDEASRYMTIECVEKPLNMLCCWIEDPNSDYFKKHLPRIGEYLWVGEDGMKVQSFGSQTWDCAFAVQALLACTLTDEIGPILMKAHDFLKICQVTNNPPGDFKSMFRHMSKGAWTFSNKDHGWPVSDYTAEALLCCLHFSLMQPEIVGEKMEPERFYDAINCILPMQWGHSGDNVNLNRL